MCARKQAAFAAHAEALPSFVKDKIAGAADKALAAAAAFVEHANDAQISAVAAPLANALVS